MEARHLTCRTCRRTETVYDRTPAACTECRGTLAPAAEVAAALRAAGQPIDRSSLLFAVVHDGQEWEVTEDLYDQMLEALPPAFMRFPWDGFFWEFGFAEGAMQVVGFRHVGKHHYARQTDLWPGDDPRAAIEPEPVAPAGVLRTWLTAGRHHTTPRRRARVLRALATMTWHSPEAPLPALTAGVVNEALVVLHAAPDQVHSVGVGHGLAPLGLVGLELGSAQVGEHPLGRLRIYYVDEGCGARPILQEVLPHPQDYRGHQLRIRPVYDQRQARLPVIGVQAFAYLNRSLRTLGPIVLLSQAATLEAQDGEVVMYQAVGKTVEETAVAGLHALLEFEAAA